MLPTNPLLPQEVKALLRRALGFLILCPSVLLAETIVITETLYLDEYSEDYISIDPPIGRSGYWQKVKVEWWDCYGSVSNGSDWFDFDYWSGSGDDTFYFGTNNGGCIDFEAYSDSWPGYVTAEFYFVANPNSLPNASVALASQGPFYEGDDIVFTAAASDPDGAVAKIEFWLNGSKVRTDTAAPYAYTRYAVPAGSHQMYVKAYDYAGGMTQSSAISFSVGTVGEAPNTLGLGVTDDIDGDNIWDEAVEVFFDPLETFDFGPPSDGESGGGGTFELEVSYDYNYYYVDYSSWWVDYFFDYIDFPTLGDIYLPDYFYWGGYWEYEIEIEYVYGWIYLPGVIPGEKYSIQTKYAPGDAWTTEGTITPNSSYISTSIGEWYDAYDVPPFIRIVKHQKPVVTSGSVLEILGVGTVENGQLKISMPEMLGVPSSVAGDIDWGDLEYDPLTNSGPWVIDLDGDSGNGNTIELDPDLVNGQVKVALLGEVNIILDPNGAQLNLGRFQVRRTHDGEFIVNLPTNLLGIGDHTLTLGYNPPTEVAIVPDYNRDGVIDGNDRGKVRESSPWRWWVNDDDDRLGEDRNKNGSNIPGFGTSDSSDLKVDGLCDLVDFFPLYLDLDELLEEFPEASYQYLLHHEDEALNCFEFEDCVLDGSNAELAVNAHITNVPKAIGFEKLQVEKITQAGFEISESFLLKVKDGKGVLLVEGSATTSKPLRLNIVKSDTDDTVFEHEFPIKIVNVEDMYRRVNLRGVAGGSGGASEQTNQPAGYPDVLTSGKYLAYIHGYNVDGEDARGSHSAIFKKFHQLGSNARFIGISWFGNPSPPYGSVANAPPPDYHKAVVNAFLTSEVLESSLSFTNGSDLTVIAHSLGNMVVSNAIAFENFSPSRYYLVNAAVAIQAYDNAQKLDPSGENMIWAMTEFDWAPYERRLYASYWHELFPQSDNRSKLTWRDRFASSQLASIAYNFYSPGDEVVEDPVEGEQFGSNTADAIWRWDFWNADLARHAWVNQEIAKGGQNSLTVGLFNTIHGGWEFNDHPFYVDGNGNPIHPVDAEQINSIHLKTTPFFKPFVFSNLHNENLGSSEAAKKDVIYETLASGIPSESYAVAPNRLNLLGESRNYNMMSLKNDGQWLRNDGGTGPDWLHSDVRDIAIVYTLPVYEKMIEISNLNQ